MYCARRLPLQQQKPTTPKHSQVSSSSGKYNTIHLLVAAGRLHRQNSKTLLRHPLTRIVDVDVINKKETNKNTEHTYNNNKKSVKTTKSELMEF